MYCPNCAEPISTAAKLCVHCGADFSSSSGWKPVPSLSRRAPVRPIFSGRPKLIHAAQSIAVFAVLGPVVGLLAIAAASETKGAIAFAFHPFSLIGAFAVGGSPALLAGCLYCVVALGLVAVFPRMTVGVAAGAAIGALVGYGASAGYFHLLLSGSPHRVDRIAEMGSLSAGAGLICGFVSAWLVPVGRSPVDAYTRF